MKECKRHYWRVGSGIGEFDGKEIVEIGINIWCERCNKKLRAYYNASYYIMGSIKRLQKELKRGKENKQK